VISSLKLRTEPTVRQTEAILARIERDLKARGVIVTREGFGAMSFRMPPPWRAAHLGLLLPITSGWAKVSAGAGERWRVRYELSFAALRGLAIALSVALIAVGWAWPRIMLLSRLVLLWAVVYGAPWAIGALRFRRLVEAGAREVVERRKTPRAVPAAGAAPSGEVPAFPATSSERRGESDGPATTG